MATVNFSVPDEIRDAFNDAFAGENKSAVIARLMQEAVEERRRQERRRQAIEGLLRVRQEMPTLTDDELCELRETGRP
jgi:metal-responsive CopG/Arc/MetJ family transcriptional regulator